MANYTMTLKQINEEPLYHWFIKDYPFYVDDDDAKKEFEQKFYDYYFDREIGFETVERYLMKMKGYLRLKMPYYQLMYETILRTKNIEFMLNKDLRETFIREVDSENQTTGTNSGQQISSTENSSQQNTTTTNSVSQDGTSTNTHKESSIQDGVSISSLTDGYLTGASSDNGTNTVSGTTESTDNVATEGTTSDNVTTTGSTTQTGNGKTLEKTELLSQGNIGITSSAQLLKEWRDVLINMDKIIIESCNDLFLKIY